MKKVVMMLALMLTMGMTGGQLAFADGDGHKGSPMEDMSDAKVAMDGFCPVCISKGKYMKGSPKFATYYEGKIYHFPNIDIQKKFVNDPEQYLDDVEAKYKKLMKENAGKSMKKDHSSGSGYHGSH